MIKYELKSALKEGLSATRAVKIVELAKKEDAKIQLSKNGQDIAARSVLSLLSMGIDYKDSIDVTIEGVNARKVAQALNSIFEYVE